MMVYTLSFDVLMMIYYYRILIHNPLLYAQLTIIVKG
jgi:hypothetical protein